MADDGGDNVIWFDPQARETHRKDAARADDELLDVAKAKIAEWKAAGMPSLAAVQDLFGDLIEAQASPMLRDRVIALITADDAFGNDLGSKRGMQSTWTKLVKDFEASLAQNAREITERPELTPEEKSAMRAALWPGISELAQAPDLMDRAVKQVQSLGVVNENLLITLTFIAAVSRVLEQPINILIKGVSSGGKSFTVSRTLDLVDPDCINKLTSSSALSLVYDTRPLSHTVMLLFEAAQMQANGQSDKDSTFAMLVRTLISEGEIIHQVSIEDPGSPNGRRVERIVRKGPIALITTTTGELYSENETRMLTWHIHEDQAQTAAIMGGLAARSLGTIETAADLSVWHDLQRWIALGPNDAVVPFARQIASKIPPLMVRFRRDVGALFSFIKASAILHQAQRQVDAQGRVIATVDDYRVAFPIFSRVLAEAAGRTVSDNVRAVVQLITERAGKPAAEPKAMRFTRAAGAGHATEVTISREQIGLALGTSKWAAYRATLTAIDLGFLGNNETRPKKPFRLVLKQGIDTASAALLPDPQTIIQDAEGGAA